MSMLKLAAPPAAAADRSSDSGVLDGIERALLTMPAYAPRERTAEIPVEPPRRTWMMGVPIDALTQRQVVNRILTSLESGRGGSVVTPNLEILRKSRADLELKRLIRAADLVIADGMPLVWASKIAGDPLPERVAGSDLLVPLAQMAARGRRSMFLLGGSPGTAEAAADHLCEQAPGLEIAGTRCPPFGFEDSPQEIAAIRAALVAAKPDIVLVALGAPKQERLMELLREDLPEAWFLGVGFALGFLAGEVKRAPVALRRSGLEWTHRLVHEPGRLAGRYLRDGLPFAGRLGAWAVAKRMARSGERNPRAAQVAQGQAA
jgi:N-acetylglucosaminyldiphosphoundecaprenol N-acetyl-beta-D-mannosaminyltransferase